MAKCRICDKRLPPDAQLCPSCGAPVPTIAAPQPQDAEANSVTASGVEPDAAADTDASLDQDVIDLLESGQKIRAVKLYRERYHCSLVEAKEAVESAATGKMTAGSGSGCASVLVLVVAATASLLLLLA